METPQAVNSLINCLTNDEDLRQELWAHYLSGNAVETFASHLEKVSLDSSMHDQLKEAVADLLENPPSQRLADILSHFSDFERSIMCLLVLGLTPKELSAYKGISEVRIRQTIASIRYNSMWEQVNGIKEKLK